MNHLLFISIFLFSQAFCFSQNNIIPIESKSGLYELTDNNEVKKVENLHYSLLFPETIAADNIVSTYYIKITIGNNQACKLTFKETEDSIFINTQYLYIDISEVSIAKSSFKTTSYKNSEYVNLSGRSFTKINFYETIPVYLIVDFPMVIRGKTYIIHLKPGFSTE